MKQSGLVVKLLSVLLAFAFVFGAVIEPTDMITVSASDFGDAYEKLSPQEKQAYLEQKLKEVNEKLSTLNEQSTETEEYINTLDERIGYLQRELQLAKYTIESSKKRIEDLKAKYISNEQEINELQKDIEDLKVKSDELQKEFNDSYAQYSQRAKALYISGDMSTLSIILTSEDMSTLFTRLEMIRQVAKSDRELLEGLQNEGEELMKTQATLEDKKGSLSATQASLISTQENLQDTIKTLELQQAGFNEKQRAYEGEKDKADALLLKLHNDTQIYSEYRNEDLEELNKINAEIEQAAQDFLDRMEAANKTTTTTTTTKKPTTTTTSHSSTNGTGSNTKPATTTTTTTKKTTTAQSKLSLTYPIPSQKKITCGYYDYSGHSGVDFACDTGSKVVAAEDGEVIISKDVYCNRSTCTNRYHGGGYCSYGRYIVIAHTKKNASGNYVFTVYAHNSERLVEVGQKVKKGQKIALSGSTGNSTGPHCHFEVRTPTGEYKDHVDPTPYLS